MDAARKDQWQRLPEMLAEVENARGDEIYRNSLVRLLRGCSDPRKWPALIAALKDDSPLGAGERGQRPGRLLTARRAWRRCFARRPIRCGWCGFAPRPRRPRAAGEESPTPTPGARRAARRREFQEAMAARPDDWASYANLGGFEMDRGDYEAAAASL